MPKTRNQRTLCQLLAQGGKIVPVEDKDLLIGTYLAVKKQDEEKMYHLLQLRDEAVARNVDSDLKDGETGVLLFGCEHNVGTIIRETYPSIQVKNFEGRTAALYARWKELVRIAKVSKDRKWQI